jgi:chromosome segregation ATPase
MENLSVTDIIAIVGVLVMLWKTFLSKGDRQKLKGDNDKIVTETGQLALDNTADALSISKEAAAQVKEMREELTANCKKYEREIEGLRMDVEELQFELDEAKAENESLRDWADRLVNQVKTYAPANVEPVKMKTPRKVVRKADKEEL